MNRILACILAPILLAGLATPAAGAPRNFTITSFDRIRMEAPFEVSLSTGKSPFARAEGPVAALDTIDLRVEGRTLIVRQRSGWNGAGQGVPVRISLGTPELRTASLVGSGRLLIDKMSGLSITLGLAGPGQIKVADLRADGVELLAGGSGSVTLAGLIKKGRIGAEGTTVIDAAALQSDELVVLAGGNAEVRAAARRSANVTASGAAIVTMQSPVACLQKVTGGASISNCR